MPEQRRKFSPQFKAEAVQMVLETGKPIAEVARDLGIHEGTLGNWVNIEVFSTDLQPGALFSRMRPGQRLGERVSTEGVGSCD
jgi:transposase-like protein